MPFDIKKFKKTKFESRKETVPVPSLKDFFDEGEKAEFVVRGLTGEEFARVREAQQKYQNVSGIIEALAGTDQKEKIQAITESLGIGSEDLPEDMVRRMEIIQLGSVEPELDLETAKKIFQTAPVTAYEITNKIQTLSGQGMMPGEQ